MREVATADPTSLPKLIDQATKALAGAKTAAQVLEAKEKAGAIYDVAKRTARFAKAQKAHDSVVAAAFRAQGDALKIESRAKERLSEEHQKAVKNGEVGGQGRPKKVVSSTTLGIKADHRLNNTLREGRLIIEAERKSPGIIERSIDEQLEDGGEPYRAHVRKVINAVVFGGPPPRRKIPKNPHYVPDPVRDAMSRLGAIGRDITRICGEYAWSDLASKFVDDDHRESTMADVRAGRDVLIEFLREVDR